MLEDEPGADFRKKKKIGNIISIAVFARKHEYGYTTPLSPSEVNGKVSTIFVAKRFNQAFHTNSDKLLLNEIKYR